MKQMKRSEGKTKKQSWKRHWMHQRWRDVSFDVSWCEKSVAAKEIHAPHYSIRFGLAWGEGTQLWRRQKQPRPKWGRKNHVHAFCT